MNNSVGSEKAMTNRKTIVSLIISILAVLFFFAPIFGIILGVIGLIFGIVGLNEVKKMKQSGKGLAIWGISLNSIGIVLPIIFMIIGYIAYSNTS